MTHLFLGLDAVVAGQAPFEIGDMPFERFHRGLLGIGHDGVAQRHQIGPHRVVEPGCGPGQGVDVPG